MKLMRYLTTLSTFLVLIQLGHAADLQWTNANGNEDFFDEGNWVISDGDIGGLGVGNIPPAGTIDPIGIGTSPVVHNLFVIDDMADMSIGDLGLDAEMGSLTINGTGQVMSEEPYTSILSTPDANGNGADVTTNDTSELMADSLSGIELDINDESVVSLFSDSDPLSGNTRAALSSMPSPCLVLTGISPTNAMTMYGGNITTTPGATINFGANNPFGTVIKAANLPEPSGMFSTLFALGLLSLARRRK